MKDVIISGRRVTRELLILLGCIGAALAINIYAIIKYKTDWKELVTTLHITIAVGVVIYVALGVLRLILAGVARLFGRKGVDAAEQNGALDPLKESAAK